MNITLEQLLKSREVRAENQRRLLQKYKGNVLLCLTVVMPGKEKRNTNSLIVARAAINSIDLTFEHRIIYKEEKDLETGFEAYYIVQGEALEIKKEVCQIEQKHLLGRLFDIDVISKEGVPITRQEIGEVPRKCLICEKESRFCMRNFTHTQEELQAKISQLIATFTKQNSLTNFLHKK